MVKITHLSHSGLFYLAAIIALSGCNAPGGVTHTPEIIRGTPSSAILSLPTGIPDSSRVPISQTLATTPNPTPLIDLTRGYRDWLPEPILIQAGVIHDLKRDPFDRDPSFVLFSNGTLIQKNCSTTSCDYTNAKLNTKQICSLLNTVDLYGFYDYDPSSYQTPIAGGEITYIEVSAWRSQHIALYQLKDWLEDPNWLDRLLECNDCRKPPEIKSALSETYWLLDSLEIPGTEVFHPESLALWLSEPELAGEPADWSLSSPSLSRLAGMSQCQNPDQHQAVVLTGSEAESVASYINQVINQGLSPIFSENGLVHQISTRWLLPYEQAAGCGESTNRFPSADIPLPIEMMSCRVSDGVIPTPTSTWIP
jgi:hypothetical protein